MYQFSSSGLSIASQITNCTAGSTSLIANDCTAVEEPVFVLVEPAKLEELKERRPSLPVIPTEDLEDLADALEAEAEYLAKGKDAFRSYDEYRARRLRQGV